MSRLEHAFITSAADWIKSRWRVMGNQIENDTYGPDSRWEHYLIGMLDSDAEMRLIIEEMKMNQTEYVALAMRTDAVGKYADIVQRVPGSIRLLHGVIGLCSEFGELLEAGVRLKEELGDCCWYLALICDSLGIPFLFPDVEVKVSVSYDDAMNSLISAGGELANLLKRHHVYGSLLDPSAFASLVTKALVAVDSLSYYGDCDFDEILEANIAKLRSRFPDKFSERHALNRDLAAEGVALSGGIA